MAIAGVSDVSTAVVGAIHQAAQATGTGFDYLLKTAMRESNFNPKAKSSKSSATGLYQFIDQTWLATVKQSGASLGYGRYADAITRTSSGRYMVPNWAMRRAVMNLRYDPSANAAMAGAFTKDNATRLTRALGRAPTDGELYIAHVLGQSGAVKLITSAENAPQTDAARLFPHAARANHSHLAIESRFAALRRNRDLLQPHKIFSRKAVRVVHDVFGRALGDDFTAVNAGTWPHVDHMIGGSDRFLVMLHHHDGVAEIAQTLE